MSTVDVSMMSPVLGEEEGDEQRTDIDLETVVDALERKLRDHAAIDAFETAHAPFRPRDTHPSFAVIPR